MKKILLTLLILFSSVPALAENTHYSIRVDGLACPFCAYGIEKKLKAIDGVQAIDVDLDKGLVSVTGHTNLQLNDEQMTTLFQDAGFTFRSMTQSSTATKNSSDE